MSSTCVLPRFLFVVLPFLFVQSALSQVLVEPAFPELQFDSPVDLQHAGDGTNRLFLVEQNEARIWVFPNDAAVQEATLFLDLSDRVLTAGYEEGLLGLAFHPDYATNGFFYVYYSAASPRRSVVARYSVSSNDPDAADPASDRVILEVDQPYDNHNGGQLAFGPTDGYLYIALGDGGSGGDPERHGQNRETLLGSILRIDVDGETANTNYRIPTDNPYAGNSEGYREEIYAYGLRNPWRFSFDVPTGQLWTGDVGQGGREEIDIIVSGGNYGWRTMEGSRCFAPSVNCNQEGLILPVWEYGRTLGQSVTGGHVYRGARTPELNGFYIYSDFATGHLWAFRYNEGQTSTHLDVLDTELNVASFGVSETNELYVLAFDGRIYHFTSEGTPVVFFDSGPENGSTLPSNSASFSWATQDGSGFVTAYEASLAGPTTQLFEPTIASAQFSDLENGTYTFCVSGRDNDGNWSEPACTTFEVNVNTIPEVTLTVAPADGSTVNDEQIRFAWNGSDEDGTIVLYEVEVTGQLATLFETPDTETVLEELTDGEYTVCVRAQDDDGNWSPSACVGFAIDLSLPDITPAIGLFLNGTLPPLTPNSSGDPDRTAPALISEIDAFANAATLEVVEGVLPYDLIQPFWSDGALKRRWMAVPSDGIPDASHERIGYSDVEDWTYPIGSVLIKHFDISTDETQEGVLRRLETRFMVRGVDGAWYGLTYKWRPDESDADLESSAGSTETLSITTAEGARDQDWYFPGRADCFGCHSTNAGSVLGPKARQLNSTVFYPDIEAEANQIEELHRRGFLGPDPIDTASLLTIAPINDSEASLDDRARSYLDVNCGYCHQDGGTGRGFFDARLTVDAESQGIVNGAVIDMLSQDGTRVIVPGDLERSSAYIRINSLFEEVMMPPLAKNRVDTAAISLMQAWITELEALPVELVRFEGYRDGADVHLSWSTASELNNAGFAIERHIEYSDTDEATSPVWSQIGFIEGKGTTDRSQEYVYRDYDVPVDGQRIHYRLKQIDFDGAFAYSEEVAIEQVAPRQYALHKNYPNPFNPATVITYEIPVESHVEVTVFDVQGREVEVLVSRAQSAGRHSITFESSNLVSGIYFYRLTAGAYEQTGSMLLVK